MLQSKRNKIQLRPLTEPVTDAQLERLINNDGPTTVADVNTVLRLAQQYNNDVEAIMQRITPIIDRLCIAEIQSEGLTGMAFNFSRGYCSSLIRRILSDIITHNNAGSSLQEICGVINAFEREVERDAAALETAAYDGTLEAAVTAALSTPVAQHAIQGLTMTVARTLIFGGPGATTTDSNTPDAPVVQQRHEMAGADVQQDEQLTNLTESYKKAGLSQGKATEKARKKLGMQ